MDTTVHQVTYGKEGELRKIGDVHTIKLGHLAATYGDILIQDLPSTVNLTPFEIRKGVLPHASIKVAVDHGKPILKLEQVIPRPGILIPDERRIDLTQEDLDNIARSGICLRRSKESDGATTETWLFTSTENQRNMARIHQLSRRLLREKFQQLS